MTAELRVATSIRPVHSLVAAVMAGAGTPELPELIVNNANSPHSNALKPSSARALAKADIIFWIGPALETYLEKPVRTIGEKAISVELGQLGGMTRFLQRKLDESGNLVAGNNAAIDPHVWLDPQNAKVMVDKISTVLSQADPKNRKSYTANAKALNDRLEQLTREIASELQKVKNTPFIVYHDAFQYFESRFGLTIIGSLTANPEIGPSARRLSETKNKIAANPNVCIFSDPQMQQQVIRYVGNAAKARFAELDLLGVNFDPGPGLYFQTIRSMAKTIRSCLSGK